MLTPAETCNLYPSCARYILFPLSCYHLQWVLLYCKTRTIFSQLLLEFVLSDYSCGIDLTVPVSSAFFALNKYMYIISYNANKASQQVDICMAFVSGGYCYVCCCYNFHLQKFYTRLVESLVTSQTNDNYKGD